MIQLRKVKEADLLRATRKMLNTMKAGNPGRIEFRRIHVSAIPRGFSSDGYRATSRNFDMRGMEDLQVYLPRGVTLYVELKSEFGRQSDAQKLREQELRELDHLYFIIRDVWELVHVLRYHGITSPFYQPPDTDHSDNFAMTIVSDYETRGP